MALLGAVALASFAGARRTASALDRAQVEARSRDVVVAASPGVARAIAALPEVETAAPLAFAAGTVEGVGEEVTLTADPTGTWLFSIDRPVVVAGRMPHPDAASEVLVTEPTADALSLTPGDRIAFQPFPGGHGHDGEATGAMPELSLVVVGVSRDLDDAVAPSGGRIYGTPALARALGSGDTEDADLFAVRLRPGATSETFDAKARAIARNGDTNVSIDHLEGELRRLDDALGVVRVGLLVLGTLTAAVTTVVLALMVDRQVQLAVAAASPLHALGLDRAALAASAAAPLAPVALGGAVSAAVLAAVVSPLASFGIAERVDPVTGIRIDVPVLAAGAVVIMTLVAAASLGSGWRWAARSSRPAPSRPSAIVGQLTHLGSPPSALVGVGYALEGRFGTQSHPVRTTVLAAVVGVTGVAGATVLAAHTDRTVSTPERYGRTWDAVVGHRPEQQDEVMAVLGHTADVAAAAYVTEGQLVAGGEQLPAYAFRPIEGRLSLRLIDGRAPSGPDEVALGMASAEQLEAGIGDVIVPDASPSQPLRVVGVAIFPGRGTSLIRDGAWLTPDSFDAVAEAHQPPELWLRWRASADAGVAARELEAAQPGLMQIFHMTARPGEIANLARTSWVPVGLGALAGTIGIVALAHGLLATASGRRTEVAVLQALGFRDADVRTTFAVAAFSVAVLGLAVGVPLGLAIGHVSWASLASRIGFVPGVVVPVDAVALLAAATLAVAVTCSLPPAHRALRGSPGQALRAE